MEPPRGFSRLWRSCQSRGVKWIRKRAQSSGKLLIAGPIALVLGILAMKALKQNPMLLGTGHAVVALVTGALSTLLNWGVVLSILIAGLTARP